MGRAYSSGVQFDIPSTRYWLIGDTWYDLEPFLNRHPGGGEALLIARDRFGDCTLAFEAYHHDYRRSRAVLSKYAVSPPDDTSRLTADDFYAALRDRATTVLRAKGFADGGPTLLCHCCYWTTFAAWLVTGAVTLRYGSLIVAALMGAVGTILGAFGHNWVHQPRYRTRARFSLDVIGLNSDAWFREHNLQHHMYTNTVQDNHFHGTDPFLVVDPTVERSWLQQNVTPFLNPAILACGILGNYIYHSMELLQGRERIHPSKLIWPFEALLLVRTWGWVHGLALFGTASAVTSIWYFSLALMNHNSHRCHDIERRETAKSWAHLQVLTCTDWCTDASFLTSALLLWLNTHTVHHLFPRVDISHHRDLQAVLETTCRDFQIEYRPLTLADSYLQMIDCFRRPMSFGQRLNVLV